MLAVLSCLKKRNLLSNTTFLSSTKTDSISTVYSGFDPTADSLHAGNLLSIISLLHFKNSNIKTVALIGGATGCIGDPSGRSTERNQQSIHTITQNTKSLSIQLSSIFNNAALYFERRGFKHTGETRIVNNMEWYGKMSMFDFLGCIGDARVSTMLSRDSVKSRMQSTEGISYTEFTYQLLQAYDFWILYEKHGCNCQVGGSDQWGNIIGGIELVRRKLNALKLAYAVEDIEMNVHGVTIPLMTTETGEKFGKSAGNAIWLDPKKLSPFDFYQFFRKTRDGDVEKYLKSFTFMDIAEIEHVVADPHQAAQKKLAFEVTELVHGYDAALESVVKSKVLFENDFTDIRADELLRAFKNDERLVEIKRDESEMDLTSIAVESKLVTSRNQAKKLIASGGFYLNNIKVDDANKQMNKSDLIDGKVIILRTGKSNHKIVHFIDWIK